MKDEQNTTAYGNKKVFLQGIHDGVPIGLGYLAVSFSLGITVKNAGLTPFQGFITSLLCNASAGEYAGFTLIAANAAYIEIALITLIANARYLLMSFAMSQRMNPSTPMRHRLLMSFDLTDELFGIAMARPGYLNPWYTYGAMLIAIPCWSVGTAIGTIAGNLLPVRLVSALSVAIFGMFLAIIIPPRKTDKIVTGIVAVCFLASFAASKVPIISALPEGTRVIILTIALASAASLLFPKPAEQEDSQ